VGNRHRRRYLTSFRVNLDQTWNQRNIKRLRITSADHLQHTHWFATFYKSKTGTMETSSSISRVTSFISTSDSYYRTHQVKVSNWNRLHSSLLKKWLMSSEDYSLNDSIFTESSWDSASWLYKRMLTRSLRLSRWCLWDSMTCHASHWEKTW
jgi:hypothetical protein